MAPKVIRVTWAYAIGCYLSFWGGLLSYGYGVASAFKVGILTPNPWLHTAVGIMGLVGVWLGGPFVFGRKTLRGRRK